MSNTMLHTGRLSVLGRGGQRMSGKRTQVPKSPPQMLLQRPFSHSPDMVGTDTICVATIGAGVFGAATTGADTTGVGLVGADTMGADVFGADMSDGSAGLRVRC
jgi:hypothetical protein